MCFTSIVFQHIYIFYNKQNIFNVLEFDTYGNKMSKSMNKLERVGNVELVFYDK